ncbi:hypothetical protein [Niallia sp. Krafla_26]|uniref:hypothetical protein n=1 Tax=Niallia sp. Krafla_26 TaxID=3064703 RepID=UPI003D178AEE
MATYSSPVLYDKSETLVEEFTLRVDRRKCLIISTVSNEDEFIFQISGRKEFELVEVNGELNLDRISEILNCQTMGTQLYISAKWDDAVLIFTEAVEAGFSEDEIQTKITGKKRKHLYCIKCYHLQEIEPEVTDTTCYHCQIDLEVGPFFSKERKGYIGYPYNPAMALLNK